MTALKANGQHQQIRVIMVVNCAHTHVRPNLFDLEIDPVDPGDYNHPPDHHLGRAGLEHEHDGKARVHIEPPTPVGRIVQGDTWRHAHMYVRTFNKHLKLEPGAKF